MLCHLWFGLVLVLWVLLALECGFGQAVGLDFFWGGIIKPCRMGCTEGSLCGVWFYSVYIP